MAKHTMSDLYQMQSLPLKHKITMTKKRIEGWYNAFDGEVYVSFSGGKDSTVLVDIVTDMGYTDIPLVFVDTGLEYPETRKFVESYGERVDWLRPNMNFRQVIEKYGYPFISKEVSRSVSDVRKMGFGNCYASKLFDGSMRGSKFNKEKWSFLIYAPFDISNRCCDVIKKTPLHEYNRITGRKAITAQMAEESQQRTARWLENGCNGFDMKTPISNPMSFWTEQDVLEYIKTKNILICSVYGEIVPDLSASDDIEGQMRFDDLTPDLWTDELKQPKLKTTGCDRTGCMFCGFGCHLNNDDRFVKMKETHPKQYEWIMKPWNEGGLEYKKVIDWLNKNGNLNIRY